MATAQARRLTEAHRLAQARLGAQTVLAMRSIWPLVDISDLDGSFARWLTASSTIIGGQRRTSARLAANYLQTFKTLELGATARAVPLVLAEDAAVAAVSSSLAVTGPVSVRKALERGVMAARALDVAEARSSAAAMRHVLNGGRETIVHSLAADRQAVGWERVTSGAACNFCASLAGRGAVYSAGTVDFHAHDGCSCSASPVYRG